MSLLCYSGLRPFFMILTFRKDASLFSFALSILLSGLLNVVLASHIFVLYSKNKIMDVTIDVK